MHSSPMMHFYNNPLAHESKTYHHNYEKFSKEHPDLVSMKKEEFIKWSSGVINEIGIEFFSNLKNKLYYEIPKADSSLISEYRFLFADADRSES